ncbi:MAG: branched-chain amino acid ABC transporter substrate-binding protein [Kineosporiaceae bacterium]|jgi:branched-chain amino acid transport system substrate-binding protein
MRRRLLTVGAAAVAGVMALAACGGGSSGDAGGGSKTVIVSTDQPLQGASGDSSNAVNNAIKLYLEQIGSKAGDYTVELKIYDDSTAAKGQWDDATCAKNAQDHVANANEVAVMGTINSGCAKIIAPVLNQDPNGPMLMVSHANTNPGLTKTWDPGEPQKYFPTGTRSYARVITTDDYQGAAAALYAKEKLAASKVYILNDNQTYGQGVAKAFEDKAEELGLEVLGNEPWDAKQPNYTSLFNKIKAAGPDLVYIGGIYDNNGGQLVKDKVAVLGDNEAVPMIGPDGFTGYPELQKLPQGQGMYLTFAGLSNDQLREAGGSAAKLLDDYKAKYGSDPSTSFALYGVAAMQVILAAIEKSDGTRKSITEQVFSGEGITIPADKSAIGKEIKIDPATGDTSAIDISVLVIKDDKETFVAAQPVS